MKCFNLKSACGRYVLKQLKEHSAVVVKKEFWLRKVFNLLSAWFLDREIHQLVFGGA